MDDSLIGRSTHEANYALSMLIDTAATTRIVEEILTAPIIE